ncbi:hypothetical protein CPB85DRAFT_540785 [Mucidula mucida]|nr:hypothetical protein CPB85DRAFT_540785 [Mucidula mucida]
MAPQTPPRPTVPLNPETPQRAVSDIQQPGGDMLDLKQQHRALRKSTAYHIVQLPAETFIQDHLRLPQYKSIRQYDMLVNNIFKELKEAGLLTKDGWTELKIDARTEDATFENLCLIIDKIHDICIEWEKGHGKHFSKATARLQCDARRRTNSEINGGSMMMDAHFVLTESTTPGPPTNSLPDTADVSGPAEFKKLLSARGENEFKLAGNVGHTMANDPCRWFVIAFTIEDQEMRFWYFSRSHIAIGEAFDNHENPMHFIRFVIFMTFANRVQLGYDPTVVRIRDGAGNIRYRFQVNGKFYLSEIAAIDEESARDIVTRATRVWGVEEVDPNTNLPINGEKLVLKDVWLFDDAKGEKAIQDDIFAQLRKLDVKVAERIAAGQSYADLGVDRYYPPPQTLETNARSYFLTIMEDEVVLIGSEQDVAPAPGQPCVPFVYVDVDRSATVLPPAVRGAGRSGVDGTPPQQPQPPTPQVAVHKARVHCRVIFREHCKRLDALFDYGDYTLAICQLLEGLNFLRLAGYVHRDISPGNVLFVKNEKGALQIKISDLEYARSYGAESSNATPLTGTPGYMAVEYQLLCHLFLPETTAPPQSKPDFSNFDFENADELNTPVYEVKKSKPSPRWFRFNFLHDVESALWLYCSLLFHSLPSSANEKTVPSQSTAKVQELAKDLFGFALQATAPRSHFVMNVPQHEAAVGLLEPLYSLDEEYGPVLLQGLNTFQNSFSIIGQSRRRSPFRSGPHSSGTTAHSSRSFIAHYRANSSQSTKSLWLDYLRVTFATLSVVEAQERRRRAGLSLSSRKR